MTDLVYACHGNNFRCDLPEGHKGPHLTPSQIEEKEKRERKVQKGKAKMHTAMPLGCGEELTRKQLAPLIGRVDITYFCTACLKSETVSVRWRSHHALPPGWRCRDIFPTNELPRRTDHIFCCGEAKCRTALDKLYPPPSKPKWFATS